MNVLEILKEEARKVAKDKDSIYCKRHKGVLYEILYELIVTRVLRWADELVLCFKSKGGPYDDEDIELVFEYDPKTDIFKV